MDGHNHDTEADKIVENTMIITRNQSFFPKRPVNKEALEERVKHLFLEMGQLVSIEGIIPGHLKGIIKEDESYLALSITRAGQVDLAVSGDWAAKTEIKEYQITVNIISLHPVEIDIDKFMEKMIL